MADELRRSYHDRIAHVRTTAIHIVRVAADALGNVTPALLTDDLAAAAVIEAALGRATSDVALVESDVIDLLAQQAPVARDLRLLLASLRVSQIGELCLGLVGTIAARVGPSRDPFTPAVRERLAAVGACSAELLDRAVRAWTVLDPVIAHAVVNDAEECRAAHRRFLAALVGGHDIPVEIGVDLGMLARAYERLTDHAVEIAGRVEFAVTGAPFASAEG